MVAPSLGDGAFADGAPERCSGEPPQRSGSALITMACAEGAINPTIKRAMKHGAENDRTWGIGRLLSDEGEVGCIPYDREEHPVKVEPLHHDRLSQRFANRRDDAYQCPPTEITPQNAGLGRQGSFHAGG
jgi:hypothetical protein